MPFFAYLRTTFVTQLLATFLCFIGLSPLVFGGMQAQAEVVLELNSAEYKVKTIRGHTSAIYSSGKKDEVLTRNLMLPRIMSQAIAQSKTKLDTQTNVHIVVTDGKAAKDLRRSTDIMEYNRFLSPRVSEHVNVGWIEKKEFKLNEKMTQYWILPFGNPERTLINANPQDMKWTIQTLESTLERYINLRFDGIEASIVLDLEDGGLPATLGRWVIDNINILLIKDNYEPIDILLEARTAKGMRMGHHDHPTTSNLTTPFELGTKFPEETGVLMDMVQTYLNKIKFAQQKTNSCELLLTAQASQKK